MSLRRRPPRLGWRHDLRRRLRLRGRGPAARPRQQSAAVDLGAELRPETHAGGTLRPCAAARRNLQGEPPRLGPRLPDAKGDRKSTRLNSSHVKISYPVCCSKKKNNV